MKEERRTEERSERPDRTASHVELHRSYGVQRRLRPWKEKLELGFYKIFLFWVLGVLSLAAILAIVNFWLYYPERWVKLLLSVIIGGIVVFRLLRSVRKRTGFSRKLKKLCRKKRYVMDTKQNFFASLIWSGNREDFILETDKERYFVRYLTVRKYRSSLYLESEELLRLVKRPLNSRFTDIFDFRPRAKYYPMDFHIREEENKSGKRIVKVLLVNPVCEEIMYKKKDGGYETTGNGGEHFGYTVYTAGGFLNVVKRDT